MTDDRLEDQTEPEPAPVVMVPRRDPDAPLPVAEQDTAGPLTIGLFAAVVLLLMILIYAVATAA